MAISREHRVFEPGSEAFMTLNPGLLQPHMAPVWRDEKTDGDGFRVFSSFQGGYRALVVNLTAKCSGKTNAKGKNGKPLDGTSSLSDLCHTYRAINIRNVIEFLQDALEDRAVNERTPIAFFVQES